MAPNRNFLAFAIIFLLLFQCASATSWLDGWSYRKSHIVNASAGADVNYTVLLHVMYANGTDGNETYQGIPTGKVYLNNHSQADFDDLRFTASDGNTLLNYYIENKTDSVDAYVWVKLNANISASETTMYVYYGNSSVVSLSNGSTTFPFFDDFSGASLDTASRWTLSSGSVTISNGIIVTNSASTVITTKASFGINTAVRSSLMVTDYVYTHGCQFGYFGANNIVWWSTNTANSLIPLTWYPENNNGASSLFNAGFSPTNYNFLQIFRKSSSAIYYFNSSNYSISTNYPTGSAPIRFYHATSGQLFVDFVFVRSFADSEPFHGIFGNEEVTGVSPFPLVSSIDILPVSATSDDTLSGWCNVSSNTDSIVYYYSWFRNGALNVTGNITLTGKNNTLVNLANMTSTMTGESWIFSCMASNGTTNSSWSNSSAVTISERPPVMVSSTILPALAYPTSNLSGWCNATTPSGANVTYNYTWFKNGVAYSTGVFPLSGGSLVSFSSPTPANGSINNVTSALVNVTTNINGEHYVILDWNRSLVGWWRFENNYYDNSTYAESTACIGSCPSYLASGKFGGAYNFTPGSYCNALKVTPTGSEFKTRPMTISFWVKKGAVDNDILQYHDTTGYYGWRIWTSGGKAGFIWTTSGGGGSSSITGSSNVSDSAWHHIVFTDNGTNLTNYVDGVKENTVASSTPVWTTTMYIYMGALRPDYAPSGSCFTGFLDEVQIYNRALSTQEISASYSASVYKYFNNFTGLTNGATYNFTAYVVNTSGNVNSAQSSFKVNVSSNAPTYYSAIVGTSVQGVDVNVANVSGVSVGQNWTLQCSAFITGASSGAMNSSVKTILSSAPVMNTSVILPLTPYTNDSLVGWCNATTPDSSNVTYNYTWFRNGLINSTGTLPAQISNSVSGGIVTTIIFNGANYTAHTFTSNGTFNVTGTLNASVLVIGGGAGGGDGGNFGGGGGAGQLIFNTSFTISTYNYSVIVGSGGARAANGSNSSFSTITAIGGYAGISLTGGTSGNGFAGGIGYNSNPAAGGGGGGSTSVGTNAVATNTGGNGGNGTICFDNISRAGGGGGAGGSTRGTGTSGGGNGGINSAGNYNGFNATANTGSGGGGGVNAIGGNGGSGLVVILYQTNSNVQPSIASGISVNIGNISNNSLAISQNWTLQCSAFNLNGASGALNSSIATIMPITKNISVIVSADPLSPITSGVNSTFSCSANESVQAMLIINGISMQNESGLSLLRPAGTYIVNCSFSGDENFSTASSIITYLISAPESGNQDSEVIIVPSSEADFFLMAVLFAISSLFVVFGVRKSNIKSQYLK